jgi:hypothetical protein
MFVHHLIFKPLLFFFQGIYFGGQRRCDAGEQNREAFDPKDLLCGACSGAQIEECAIHGKSFM